MTEGSGGYCEKCNGECVKIDHEQSDCCICEDKDYDDMCVECQDNY